MKILIINHEFPPAGGGAAYASESLAKYLAKLGQEVEIITSKLSSVSNLDFRNNYKVRRILWFRRSLYSGKIYEVILFIIHGFFYFLTNFKEKNVDVVYAFFSLPAGMLGLYIKKIYRTPYYVFLRGIDVPGFYGGRFSFLNKILKPIIKYVWVNSDRIVANSQALKILASKTLKDKPIYVIPNMVDTNFFCPSDTMKKENWLNIIYVGRFNKQKGLDYLLESFAVVIKDIPESPLFLEIIGEGPEKNNLIKKGHMLNISKKIIFVNWVNRTELLERYRSADIFVSSSLDEGMPNAIMEAMACGLPIVATDISGHRELIEHGKNGLLVLLKSPKALAEAIKTLIKDRDLRERMKNNNIKKIESYNLQNISNYLQSLNL